MIGDVHGCADALEALLARIAARPDAARARLIFVGDLIDRGPDSAAVLARIRAMTEAEPDRVICLKGNHEAMCLEALESPAAMTRWLANGGDTTLASYGLSARHTSADKMWHADLAAALRAAWPMGTEAWLGALPLLWHEDRVAVSHAGGDPGRPLSDQAETALLWGHRDTRRRPRQDGIWMAHGHWIGTEVTAARGRVAVDTGAWCGGPLSVAWLDTAGLTVLSTGAGDAPRA
ncbi:MAG: metallophosphoesterase [Pseudooceanicola nanhaiensis]